MVTQVREQLIDSIRLRLRADVPVGIYLSGGVDSSAVAGITKHLIDTEGVQMGSLETKKRMVCFCISFDESSGFDESGRSNHYSHCGISKLIRLLGLTVRIDIAKRTAAFLDVELFTTHMDETQMARNFEESIWHNEQTSWDLNTVGKYVLSELPRQHGFKVILTGEGADEVFAGYSYFTPDFLLQPDESMPNRLLNSDTMLLERLQQSLDTDFTKMQTQAFGFTEESVSPEIERCLCATKTLSRLEMVMGYNRNLFLPDLRQRVSLNTRLQSSLESWSPHVKEKMRNSWHPLHTALYCWNKSHLANWILSVLGDRTEMAHSIEARPPFLDHKLAELVGSIPPSVKIHYGSLIEDFNLKDHTDQPDRRFFEKWILRQAAKPFITPELFQRRKHPYSAPVKWPLDGPLHRLFLGLVTKENIDAIGFLHWESCKLYLSQAFGDDADPSAFKQVLVIGGLVCLSKQFKVKAADILA